MAITSLDLANTRIDLADVLSWRIAQSPRFINLFQLPTQAAASGENAAPSRVAIATEHKWLEGVETPKTKAYTAYAYGDSKGTFTVASSTGWVAGDLFHILGDTAVLKIASVTSTTIVVAEIIAANGSSTTLATLAETGGTLIFDSRPIQEGSTSGESSFLQSGSESNYTQIFRQDVELTGTALAVGQYGNENNVTQQVQYATDTIIRRMNHALLFGAKVQRSASYPGSMGGLYYFGTQVGGLSNAQENSPALKMGMINIAAQMVTEAGGIPDLILTGAGQGQVISTFMAGQVQTDRASNVAGRYINQFVTSAGGNVLRVFVDPSIPDTDVWVCDSRGFALVPLNGRALHSEPATTPGTDGSRAMIIGEYTAEFKNAKQSLCRISGLQASATTLAAADAAPTINVSCTCTPAESGSGSGAGGAS